MATPKAAGSFLGLTTPFGADKLLLRRFEGEERVSAPFQYFLEMVSAEHALDFKKIVGKSATVAVTLPDGSKRHFNGIVTRFVQSGRDQRFTTYHADLHPWLWLLRLTADCRIFQQKSVPDILQALFKEAGYTDFKLDLQGSYAAREYCVQYRETLFDFVSRLMEEEGISYYFKHEDGKHTLVLSDKASAWPQCPGPAKILFRPTLEEAWASPDIITSCSLETQVRTGKVALEDYNFETPSDDLMTEADGKGKLRVYDYPGGFVKRDAGEGRANVRMQAFEARETRLTGTGLARGLSTGHRFTLAEHSAASFNQEFAVLWVSHLAEPERYHNSFEAIPSKAPLRPLREHRKPVIPGAQTARVVGKSGEEIWTDKYGRVKVQFHWDQLGKKDENSSCWVRVAQGWAGKSWGAWFLPRIGQEVVVTFLEGDPDQPLVTGSVYNAEQTVPYPLPDNQTKSTVKSNSSKGGGGYNEVRFEDKKDAEEIWVFAQKDNNIVVKHDRTKKVGHDETITIKNHRTATIEEGNESLTVAKGNRTVLVQKGNETHEVKGTRDVKVTGAEKHVDEDNFTQEVTKNYVLKVKGDITIEATGAISIKSGKDFSVDSGMNLVTKAKMNLTHDAGMNLMQKAKINMKSEAGLSMVSEAKLSMKSKAGLTMDIEGGLTVKAKGGLMAAMEGGAMLSVKGAIVKIN